MIFKIYYCISFLLWPIYRLLLLIRLFQGKEIKQRLQEKRGIATHPRPNGKVIWIHGASVGETLALIPLIKEIKKTHSSYTILLTSGTKSSAEILAKQNDNLFIHQLLPLDHPVWCKRFLKHWKPDLACISESDFWPTLLQETKKQKTPLILINGRMSPRSYKKWAKIPKTAQHLFSLFDHLFVQNKQDVEFFSKLGAQNITRTGTIKYSTPALSYEQQELSSLQDTTQGRHIWLFASSHSGEEEIALETHNALKSEHPDLLTIIVPRHPNRAPDIKKTIQSYNLSFATLSSDEKITSNTDIYLADAFGILGLLYKLSPIACIGGSFIKLGCHNPIEAAQLNCAILFGPYTYNFSETCQDLIDQHAAIQCLDAKTLQKELKSLINSPEKIATMQKNAYDLSQEKANILQNLTTLLKPYLDT